MSFDQVTYGYSDPSYHYLHDLYNVYTITVVPSSNPYGTYFKNVTYASPPRASASDMSSPTCNNNNNNASALLSSFSSPSDAVNAPLVPATQQCSLFAGISADSFNAIANATTDSIEIAELEKTLMSAADYSPPQPQRQQKRGGGGGVEAQDVEEPEIVKSIVDADLTTEGALRALKAASAEHLRQFFSSVKATRYLHQIHGASKHHRVEVQSLVLRMNKPILQQICVNPIGNFILQDIINSREDSYRVLCDAILDNMHTVTLNKYGCRVVQTLIKQVPIEMVHELIEALTGFVVEASAHRHATHVIHCIVSLFDSAVYERIVAVVCDAENLHAVAEDKFGCRVIQHFLENLATEITTDYVPQILNDLVGLLLLSAERYASNEFANYVVQFLITHNAFKRQRDYIIDRVVTGHVLAMSQDKFGSHVVEASLNSAGAPYLHKLCEEIFYDYDKCAGAGNRSALEMMMFDQFGNYVVQRLLTVTIDVSCGRRQGDPTWLKMLGETVVRNHNALQRYSSGKKIIATLRGACPHLFTPSAIAASTTPIANVPTTNSAAATRSANAAVKASS